MGFARWLESDDWNIVQLEALKPGPDVIAERESQTAAFELKYIGIQDSDFASLVESIAGQPSVGARSLSAPVNYLLFRLYEAAKQLKSASAAERIGVVLIDETTWWRFAMQLNHGWVDWQKPAFLDADDEWSNFIAGQEGKYPNIHEDLGGAICSLDEAWIVRLKDYNYTRELVQVFKQ